MVNRVVTGAGYGLRDWIGQRVTAVVIALYALFIFGWLLCQPQIGYDAWTRLFASEPMRVFTMLAMLALFYHAWVGMRDILMDYVSQTGWRLLAQVSVILALLLYLIWSVRILWGVA